MVRSNEDHWFDRYHHQQWKQEVLEVGGQLSELLSEVGQAVHRVGLQPGDLLLTRCRSQSSFITHSLNLHFIDLTFHLKIQDILSPSCWSDPNVHDSYH